MYKQCLNDIAEKNEFEVFRDIKSVQ